jgi:hypothetical protein
LQDNVAGKPPFDHSRAEAPLFQPGAHCAGLRLSKLRRVGQDGGAVVGKRQLVEVLDCDLYLLGCGIAKKAKGPQIRLAEMAETDEP